MKGHTGATLVRRYKRFLTDVKLADGSIITVHCPNTGSMKNCIEEGADVWLSKSDNPKRKYQYTWEYLRTRRGHTIGINSGRANELAAAAITAGVIPALAGYSELKREVKYGDENSRIDLLLSNGEDCRCYVEVKSVTLLEDPPSRGLGYFPDAVSKRGAKHLRELVSVVRKGHRAVLFFCVQHTGILEVRPADHVDTIYGTLLREAARAGVEIMAFKCRVAQSGFKLWREVPVVLP
ncbi:MAG: DNA/RNA nuclease SfsA [Gammaproteobacteria bacterium]|nr:DNA/RNA nuclease SfsA [Gammaproteobacteria bacterium]